MSKIDNLEWDVFFGGARREKTIQELVIEKINIKRILVPKTKSPQLANSINNISQMGLSNKIYEIGIDMKMLQIQEESGLICIGFPFKIPDFILGKYKVALNLHPTLLPKYRGPTSGAYILINNEEVTGSTVHFLTDDFDSGPIISQSKVLVSPFDTIRSMQRKVYETEPELLLNAISKIKNNELPLEQNHELASNFFIRRTPKDSEIDPNLPLTNLVNQIRANDPEHYPSFFYYLGEKMFIKVWREKKDPTEFDLL
jgi:methionyl-tRNA formyltransferase